MSREITTSRCRKQEEEREKGEEEEWRWREKMLINNSGTHLWTDVCVQVVLILESVLFYLGHLWDGLVES